MFQMRANIVAMGVIGAALVLPDLAQAEQVGHASWYALRSRTASGEMMNPSAMTAAHRSLPFGTKMLVENLSNGKAVVVRINDRGPFIAGRIIDVSKAAASSLGMLGSGTAKVRVSASGGGSPKVASASGSGSPKATSASGGGSPKIASASGSSNSAASASESESAKMASASDNKPVKVASATRGKSAKTASVSRSKPAKTAKSSSKSTKVASTGRSSVKGEKRSVAGLMKSTRDLKRRLRASSRKPYAVASRAERAKPSPSLPESLGRVAAATLRMLLWLRPPTPMALSCKARAW
jgi:rare lipoprotein A